MKHRQQILARVRKADYKFDPDWKCMICGGKWAYCEHTANDNIKIVNMAKEEDGID